MKEQVLIQFRADKSADKSLKQEVADVPEMSLEEINAKISAVRKERKNIL